MRRGRVGPEASDLPLAHPFVELRRTLDQVEVVGGIPWWDVPLEGARIADEASPLGAVAAEAAVLHGQSPSFRGCANGGVERSRNRLHVGDAVVDGTVTYLGLERRH